MSLIQNYSNRNYWWQFISVSEITFTGCPQEYWFIKNLYIWIFSGGKKKKNENFRQRLNTTSIVGNNWSLSGTHFVLGLRTTHRLGNSLRNIIFWLRFTGFTGKKKNKIWRKKYSRPLIGTLEYFRMFWKYYVIFFFFFTYFARVYSSTANAIGYLKSFTLGL